VVNIIVGSTGTLGSQLFSRLTESNEPVYTLNRKDIKNPWGNLVIDLKHEISIENLKQIEKLVNNATSVNIYFMSVANELTNKSIVEIFNVNYINPIKIADFLAHYCNVNRIKFKCIYILSSVDVLPSIKLPLYSASKASLANSLKSKLIEKNKNLYYYGIYTGPFISSMWDAKRMQKFAVILKIIGYSVEPKDKIDKILKCVRNDKSLIKFDLSFRFSRVLSFIGFVRKSLRWS